MPNSAWNYDTGNYSVSVSGHSSHGGTINLTKDGSGNLNSTATWTPGQGGNGVSVNVSWDGTNLSWSVSGSNGGNFNAGTCTQSSPTIFSGGFSDVRSPTGGTGTWTATY